MINLSKQEYMALRQGQLLREMVSWKPDTPPVMASKEKISDEVYTCLYCERVFAPKDMDQDKSCCFECYSGQHTHIGMVRNANYADDFATGNAI